MSVMEFSHAEYSADHSALFRVHEKYGAPNPKQAKHEKINVFRPV
jgi:hypothetical protein